MVPLSTLRDCSFAAPWLALGLVLLSAPPTNAQSQLWGKQLGTAGEDYAYAIAPDSSGGIYVTGTTSGALGGASAGKTDAWLARYDGTGSELWIRQIGTSTWDEGTALAADGLGGVYVSGWTFGSLGGPNAGFFDGWVARYDGTGNQVWIRQLGASKGEYLTAAAADGSGGVYVGGYTDSSFAGPSAAGWDAWLARYDGAGNHLWTRQFGSNVSDGLYAAAPDGAGGVYVGGWTEGSIAGPFLGFITDAWLARYDSAGNQVWIRQIGTSGEEVASAAAEDLSGGVYLVTWGWAQSWLTLFDSAGTALWHKTMGGVVGTYVHAVAATPDGSGGVYVSGWTDYGFGPNNGPLGTVDAFVVRYDKTGSQLWARQFGTSNDDISRAATTNGSGGVYLAGESKGSLFGPNKGGYDAWFAHYDGSCSPISTYCTAKTNSAGCIPTINASGYPSGTALSGFTISTTNVLSNKFGVYFYSKSGPNAAAFQGGFLCAQPPLVRTVVQSSGGTSPCGGMFQIDFNAYVASGKDPGLVAGQQVWIQTWSRDPGFAPPDNTSLSDAVSFTLCP
jgi:hypothetical protein